MESDFRLIRTRSIIALFSWIGAVYLILLGLVNLRNSQYISTAFDFFIALILVFNNVFFIKNNRIRYAGTLILFALLVFFTYLIVDGGLYNAGILWHFIFPVAAFLLKGKKEGAVWAASLFILDILAYVISRFAGYHFTYTLNYLMMFLMIYLFILAFIYSYESLRELSERVIIDSNNKLEKLNRELTYLSTYDVLTGVYNRGKILDLLNDELKRYKRYRKPFSILLFDVDYFKEINDTYGHQMGDKVLCELSVRMQHECLREVDSLGRYGGDEFLIILPETNIEGAASVGDKLCDCICSFIMTDEKSGKDVSVSISAGTAVISAEKNIATLLYEADMALYASKENGRNQCTIYSNS